MSRSFDCWSHAELCLWLRTSGFVDLTDKFSELELVGSDLKSLDESFLQTKVGISDAGKRQNVLAAVDALLASSGCVRTPHAATHSPSSQQHPQGRNSLQRTQTVPVFTLGYQEETGHNPRSTTHLGATNKRQSLPQIAPLSPSAIGKLGTMQAGSQPSRGVSAQQLMADGSMDYCGWIRKQGGSVRTWKRRYLILKSGCLYYYKDDSASSAQGQFSLEGYRVVETPDSKYQWCFRLIHQDAKRRVYVISVSSGPEMRHLMEKIEAAMRDWNSEQAPQSPAAGPASPTSPASPPPVMPRPASTLPSIGRQVSTQSSLSSSLRVANSSFIEHDIDDEDDSGEEDDGHSLASGHRRAAGRVSPSPEVAPRRPDMKPVVEIEAPGSDYLQLEEGSVRPPSAQQQPQPLPRQNGGGGASRSTDSDRRGQRYEITDLRKPAAKASVSKPHDDEEECDYIYPEVEVTDILPSSVFQDNMDRDRAEGILKMMNKTGAYLIRSGSSQPTQKVLSVWTDDRCRHYKVFYDEKLKFSLQRGTHFASLPTLVQHYHSNSLPKCPFKLAMPYQG